jgi:hypothetical protein
MDTDSADRKQPPVNPPVEQPNELTGIAPNFTGTVSNQPTPAPEEADAEPSDTTDDA